ncbi:MAG TPA: histidine kinase dimerization/phospho-acceptor domain-containing protein, partial [Candidatus Eremiobacteraceae bacterium]|nr:histidine kinase dimerization/phospho-acceptor domain-containing protein [Candidatus Eremiobacteraceae bacterium]
MAISSRRPLERRTAGSRIGELRSLGAPLLDLAATRRSAPLLYLELTGVDRVPAKRRRALLSACKREVATALRGSVGSVLRRNDRVAAGSGARWFVALLVDRAVDAPARGSVNDADLGLIAGRLQAMVRSQLSALARRNGNTGEIGVIAGWTVIDPVSADRPLDGLRQAIRGAAVVARVEAQRAHVLAAVTHELRTPLTAILGYAERLRDETDLDAVQRRQYGAIVAQEARRLHRLVETLIDAGAWTAGRLALAARPHSLRALARAAWASLAGTVPARRVRFTVRGDATPVVDAERIQQVFINLLDNAVRHSPAGGRVHMRIATRAGVTTINVEDEGAGFSKRAAAALGTPF